MQSRYSPPPLRIPAASWHARANLISAHPTRCEGSLLDCVRAWDRLPAKVRAMSYIVVKGDYRTESILQPKDLERYIRDPGFLSM